MTDFLLNCFVLDDDAERVFPVKIPRNNNVGILKDEIKKKKAPHLDHIAASELDLWKVCLPILPLRSTAGPGNQWKKKVDIQCILLS